MIMGIGCDLCASERIYTILQKPSAAHFLQRVFSPEELALWNITAEALSLWHSMPEEPQFSTISAKDVESMAANFAAKEAFLKASGKGIAGFSLVEIAALRKPSGAPYYTFTGAAAEYMALHGATAHLSLSHDKGLAMAYCILE